MYIFLFFSGKAYGRSNDLKKHISSFHEKLKNHICDLCGKAFTQAPHLRTHILSVHEGIKDHKCDQVCIVHSLFVCFFQLWFIIKHHNIFYFQCGKAFSQLSALTKHHRNVHEGLRNKVWKYPWNMIAENFSKSLFSGICHHFSI